MMNDRDSDQNQSFKKQITCWKCLKPGHMQRDCREELPAEVTDKKSDEKPRSYSS